jgi:hypothetical protein
MSTSLKVILAALGVAALLSSPAAMARTRHYSAPVHSDAPIYYGGYYGAGGSYGPYTPSVPTGVRDFQNGGRG